LPRLALERSADDNQGAIEEDLLGFRLAHSVEHPILGRIPLIPLKSVEGWEELGKIAHDSEYTPAIYSVQICGRTLDAGRSAA